MTVTLSSAGPMPGAVPQSSR